MIDWMPDALKRMLTSLLHSSEPTPSKPQTEEPFVGNGRPIFGSDLYAQVTDQTMEDERKWRFAQLAADAEAARKLRDLPNN